MEKPHPRVIFSIKSENPLLRESSPVEKKAAPRPMHSVAGGELGGIELEEVGVGLYRAPFHTTSLPSTVSRLSRRVL